ncbi:MAG: dipeptidase [Bacteroidia bacterium]|nr:dipeptidase [Bacteroidia bacterium]
MQGVKDYIETHKERFLEELFDLLRIPSISADSAYAKDVAKTAQVIKSKLQEAGADRAEVFSTKGHPIVFAEKILNPSLPTVMVYGHYDVQPPDPLDLWTSPPFEPEVRDSKIFARGACDDKGQMYMHVKAFEYMVANEELPCNVKFMIEGEEEVGSSSLGTFCEEHKSMLSCDVILVSDTSMIANDVPSITTGLRGLSYVEVEVTGPNRDLHSGTYGGAVANPVNALCEMISQLKDDKNQITIPGFYDKVQVISSDERKAMNEAPFDLDTYKSALAIEEVNGETGYTTLERTSIRPTLDVNGIWGGYTGEGAKTVLPSKAYAKISMRLVPNQNHDEITKLFSDYFVRLAPDGIKVKVTPHHGGQPYVTEVSSIEYQAAAKAYKKSFGVDAIPQRSGGSIPIIPLFEEVLDSKTVLMGFGLDSDNIHSPDENYGLFNYFKGIETIPYFYKYYTEMKSDEN